MDQQGQTAPTPSDEPGLMTVLQHLTCVADATMTLVGEVLAEFGLTVSSAALLWALDPRGERPTMRSLAQQLRCDPSTVSLTADRLEEAGLVERRVHPTDGRMRTLALTPRGSAVWEEFAAALSRGSSLAALSGAELRTLDALLTKVRP